jgi:hypothetical protein
MKEIRMLASFLSTVILFTTAPDTISHTFTFDENQLTFSTKQGYDFVSMSDAMFIQFPGYPSLPRKAVIFAIPAGSRVVTVESIVIDSTHITGTYSIFPTQPPVSRSNLDSIPFTSPDSVIYSLINPWPSIPAAGSELGSMDLTELAVVETFPLSWNPGTGELVLRETIQVNIILEADSIPAPEQVLMTNIEWSREIETLKKLVANPDSIESFSVQPDLVDENTKGTDGLPVVIDYLIITRAAWEDAWQPLVDWNIKRGLFTAVLTVEDIAYDAGVVWPLGRDWPETVRNSIRWQHVHRGVQYILLGTDTTPPVEGVYNEDEAPMRYCKLFNPPATPTPTSYTDWYYSCLDPALNWQTNTNPWWGEYYPTDSPNENDLMDLIPDLAVGRIPVHSYSEAQHAARQIVDYQRHAITGADPSQDLLVISAALSRAGYPENWELMQAILSEVPYYIGRRWVAENTCTIPGVIPISPNEVLRQLDGSAETSASYRASIGGHGGPNWFAANPSGDPEDLIVEDSDLRDLAGQDGNYCTAYVYNCLTGSFVVDGSNNSIVETWLGADGETQNAPLGPGYIGYNAASFYTDELLGSTSDKMNYWYLDALYNSIPSSGTWGNADAYNLASLEYASYYLAGYPEEISPAIPSGDYCYEPMWDLKTTNLGGDPALPVWLKEPMSWVSRHPSILRCPNDFTITVVTSGSIPIPGVRVCLMMEGVNGYEIYRRGYTNPSGEYTIFLNPSFSGTLHVTLTKQGYLPDEGEVRLLVE